MIRFVCAVKLQELPVFLQQLRFMIFFGLRTSFFPHPDGIVKPSCLGVGCGQRADDQRHIVMGQLTCFFCELDGFRPIALGSLRTSSQQPGQIIQQIPHVRMFLQGLPVTGDGAGKISLLTQAGGGSGLFIGVSAINIGLFFRTKNLKQTGKIIRPERDIHRVRFRWPRRQTNGRRFDNFAVARQQHPHRTQNPRLVRGRNILNGDHFIVKMAGKVDDHRFQVQCTGSRHAPR